MLRVNSLMLPTTLLEKVCTPVTTEAAKSAPGTLGSDGAPPGEAGPGMLEGVDGRR
jgi:hypothetical protein